MSKVLPAIRKPGSDKFPTRGPHNPNVGTSGSGLAPRPKGGIPVLGNDRPSLGTSAGLARAGSKPMGDKGQRLPVQSPTANLAATKIWQANPNTAAAASKKPNRKGGAAFYGE